MQLPVIGITTDCRNQAGDFYLPGAYVDAIRAAGGLPLLLPPGEPNPSQLLRRLDGLVLSGGGDLEPIRYDGEPHPTIYRIDRERDTFELALADAALSARTIPILGICRGLQVLSVASGGTLFAHLPETVGTQVLHRQENPRRPIPHSVQIASQSRLAMLLGRTEVSIVSWHHQAVRQVPKGWRVVAQAPDGIVEALEHSEHPWALAVQWHPEMSPEDPLQQALFRALVHAAQDRAVWTATGRALQNP